MPKAILVGYDPKTDERAPITFGHAAAQLTGMPLIVGAPHAQAPGFDHGAQSAELQRLRDELRASDVDADCRLLPGASAAQALHTAAEQLDAGLLVVGTRTHGPAVRLMHGLTIDRLLQGPTCPIAVVPHGWRPSTGLSTVGAAFADTPGGRNALRGAHALARKEGATLRVLNAVPPRGFEQTYAGGAPSVEARTTYSEVGGALLAEAQRMVEDATADLHDVEVDLDVSVQDPADFLTAASRELDVLICGSRDYGPLRAGVLGRVTLEAACPVIVVPDGYLGPDGDLAPHVAAEHTTG